VSYPLRRTLRAVQQDLEEARRLGRGEAGTLHVGFIGSGMLTALPAMLREYRRPLRNARMRSEIELVWRVNEDRAIARSFAALAR